MSINKDYDHAPLPRDRSGVVRRLSPIVLKALGMTGKRKKVKKK